VIPRRSIAARIAARGVVTAFGPGEGELFAGLLDGRSALSPLDRVGFPELLGGVVPEGALARSGPGDRALRLIREAALQIASSPALRRVRRERLGICVGTTQGPIESFEAGQRLLAARDGAPRPPVPSISAPALEVARLLGALGPVECPSIACASGTAAVGLGLRLLQEGRCDAVVAGGVDAVSRLVTSGFRALRALDGRSARPFDRTRAGLTIGEGAALLLLEAAPLEGAAGREGEAGDPGAAVEVLGFGLSCDASHLTGPDPTGSGVARAVRAALDDAGLVPPSVDFVNVHGTGTVKNDLMEGRGLVAVLGARMRKIPVDSIKGAIGHAMGAAGAIEAVLCALVLESGLAPPTFGLAEPDPALPPLGLVLGAPRAGDYRIALSTSSGFGGQNAALLLGRGALGR
jgi:3-oxoacyl-[acyl-carrier-protein] synthase II